MPALGFDSPIHVIRKLAAVNVILARMRVL